MPRTGQGGKRHPTVGFGIIRLDLVIGFAHSAFAAGKEKQAVIFRERDARSHPANRLRPALTERTSEEHHEGTKGTKKARRKSH